MMSRYDTLEKALEALFATAQNFQRWGNLEVYDGSAIAEAVAQAYEADIFVDKQPSIDRLKDEKVKMTRQLGAAKARSAKTKIALGEYESEAASLRAIVQEQKATITVLMESNVERTAQLGEALGLTDPPDLTDETS